MKRAWLIGIAIVLAVAAFLVGTLFSKPAAAPGEAQGTNVPSTAVTRLMAASFIDPAGQPISVSQWQGKPLIVNFWATWCPPCLKEMPAFARLQDKYPEVRFLGIAVDSPENVAAFVQKTPVNYPVLIAEPPAAMPLLGELGNTRGGLPFTLTIDPASQVLHSHVGGLSEAATEKMILELTGRAR